MDFTHVVTGCAVDLEEIDPRARECYEECRNLSREFLEAGINTHARSDPWITSPKAPVFGQILNTAGMLIQEGASMTWRALIFMAAALTANPDGTEIGVVPREIHTYNLYASEFNGQTGVDVGEECREDAV